MTMRVMKFGGTSLGTSEALRRVAGLIAARRACRPVVVVSAIGRTTDQLAAARDQAAAGLISEARWLIDGLRGDLRSIIAPILSDCTKLDALLEAHLEEMLGVLAEWEPADEKGDGPEMDDALLSHGERISSAVMTWILREHGIDAVHLDARELLVTDDRFTQATPLLERTNARLLATIPSLCDAGQTVVMGGFIGRTIDGRPSTLGRGGSDYSASIIGAGIGAEEIQIWTDVDGVMTADPALVPEARSLPGLSFAEASELAYFGGRVLHPSTMLPALEKNIPVRVLNSRKPELDGTLIVGNSSPSSLTVKSIAYKESITVIDVRSTRMLMAHGFLAEIFAVFDRHRIAVDVVATSEVGVSLTVDRVDGLDVVTSELRQIAEVSHASGQAIVCLVGDGIRDTPGVGATIFTAVADINIRMISQGSSRRNITLVIDEGDVPAVVTRLHNAFFGGTGA